MRLCAKVGWWSQVWAADVQGWYGHVLRDTIICKAPANLLEVITLAEIEQKRAESNSQGTGTRCKPGHPCMRFEEGLRLAKDVKFPVKKQLTYDIVCEISAIDSVTPEQPHSDDPEADLENSQDQEPIS